MRAAATFLFLWEEFTAVLGAIIILPMPNNPSVGRAFSSGSFSVTFFYRTLRLPDGDVNLSSTSVVLLLGSTPIAGKGGGSSSSSGDFFGVVSDDLLLFFGRTGSISSSLIGIFLSAGSFV